jgi:hypothetical protein
MSHNLPLSESIWYAAKTRGFLVVSMMCALLAATCVLSSRALAQEQVSSYNYGYFVNANTPGIPDAQMYVVNPGSTGGTSPAGDLCANVYVFAPNQEMFECCSCKVTPDGMRTFGVNTNLTNNPLLPNAPHSGVIKIVSSAVPTSISSFGAPGSCNNAASTTYSPYGYLGTWITHVNDAHHPSVSETHFLAGVLSTTELANLQKICNFIQLSGTSFGICSCGSE